MSQTLALVSYQDLEKIIKEISSEARLEITNEIWSAAEAAKYLRIGTNTLKSKASSGEIPGVKIGRDWKFSSLALYKWVAKEGDTDETR